jgi:hypothetical protein
VSLTRRRDLAAAENVGAAQGGTVALQAPITDPVLPPLTPILELLHAAWTTVVLDTTLGGIVGSHQLDEVQR